MCICVCVGGMYGCVGVWMGVGVGVWVCACVHACVHVHVCISLDQKCANISCIHIKLLS